MRLPMRGLLLLLLLFIHPLSVAAAELQDATGRSTRIPDQPVRVLPAGPPAAVLLAALERDDFSSSRHHALSYRWSMIFSENRYPLFGIML